MLALLEEVFHDGFDSGDAGVLSSILVGVSVYTRKQNGQMPSAPAVLPSFHPALVSHKLHARTRESMHEIQKRNSQSLTSMLALSEVNTEVEISEHDRLKARQRCRPESLSACNNLIDAGEGSCWLAHSEQFIGALWRQEHEGTVSSRSLPSHITATNLHELVCQLTLSAVSGRDILISQLLLVQMGDSQ